MLLAFCALRGYQAPTPGGMPVIAGARALPWYRVTQGMGMAPTEQSIVDTHAEAGVRRRDFINIAAVSFVGVERKNTRLNPSSYCPTLSLLCPLASGCWLSPGIRCNRKNKCAGGILCFARRSGANAGGYAGNGGCAGFAVVPGHAGNGNGHDRTVDCRHACRSWCPSA